MSIGKNSIKRAVNNGYSKVKTTAPDMENSEVLAPAAPESSAAVKVPVEKTAPAAAKKRACAKKTANAPAVKTETPVEDKPVQKTAKNTAKKAPVKKAAAQKAEKTYVNFGEEMPFYLL